MIKGNRPESTGQRLQIILALCLYCGLGLQAHVACLLVACGLRPLAYGSGSPSGGIS
jgi:hypothetical protein